MNSRALKKAVLRWSKQVGKSQAVTSLAKRHMSTSTITKLLAGKYPSEPSETTKAIIEEAMAEHGFSPVGEEAS